MGIDRSITDTPVGVRKQARKETLIDGIERVVMGDGGSMIILPPGTETIIGGGPSGARPETGPRGVHKTIEAAIKRVTMPVGTACKHSGMMFPIDIPLDASKKYGLIEAGTKHGI